VAVSSISRNASTVLAALLWLALLACAEHRPPEREAEPVVPVAYGAHLQVTLEAHGRGFSLPAGAAVDPARGARVELRDPLGAARLLLLLSPASGRLFSPDAREEARWEAASESLPWSPLDLWSLLVALPPPGATDARRDAEGRLLSVRWSGPYGSMKARFSPAAERLFPPASALLSGPGPARLAVVWRDARAGAPQEGALEPPAGGSVAVPLESLLEELSR
jgi:hypothetical protein